jgi:hypothetical protein
MNSAAPSFISSVIGQGSDSLLRELINYELLRALSSSAGTEANLQFMDRSMQRVLRDMLATDAGLQKLQALVNSTKNTSDEFVRQSAFENIYGTTFTKWMETKAINWIKEALGIPNFQGARLAELKSPTAKVQIDRGSKQMVKNRGSRLERVFYV